MMEDVVIWLAGAVYVSGWAWFIITFPSPLDYLTDASEYANDIKSIKD